MTDRVKKLWGEELMWIKNEELRKQVADTWELALEKSKLDAEDLFNIPFTLLAGSDMKVSFMSHKRAVVHISKDSGEKMNSFFKIISLAHLFLNN